MNLNDEKTEPLIVTGPLQRKKTRKFKLALVIASILLIGIIAIVTTIYLRQQKVDAIICDALRDNVLEFAYDNSTNTEWIYYIDHQGDLSKIKKDGSSQTKLLDGDFDAFCIAEPWVYYAKGNSYLIGKGDNMTIGKIRTDGNENTELSKLTINSEQDDTAQIKVSGDYIYYAFGKNYSYSESMPNFGIYKLKNDSNDSSKILGDEVNRIVAIEEGWIYFIEPTSTDDTGGNLYRMNLEGAKKTFLAAVSHCDPNYSEACGPVINGDWIYYINSAENDSPFKVRKDGTEKQKIYDGSATSLFARNGWIYFKQGTNPYNGEIVKIQIEGDETETLCKLVDRAGYILGIDDKWIYYIERGKDGSRWCKVGLDGKSNQRIWMFGTSWFEWKL